VPLVLLLCGTAFAGKTTFGRALAARHGCPVVSADEITERRGLHLGDGPPVAEAARSHREALAELAQHLAAGAPLVIVDDTNCYRFLRDDYRAVAAQAGADTLLAVFRVPADEVRRRIAVNCARPGRHGILPHVLEAHLTDFEWPAADEAHLDVAPDDEPTAWADRHLTRS
jgi:predicted kinase